MKQMENIYLNEYKNEFSMNFKISRETHEKLMECQKHDIFDLARLHEWTKELQNL
jgi:hypothetical protein